MPDEQQTSAERPWGAWHVLDDGGGYKVKRIEVRPGHRLSYQTHQHRWEHWLVVHGVATCTIDGEERILSPGEHIDVGCEIPHRIANEGSERLVIIEVQRGNYTGEDDIVRLEDDYQRGPA